jgi:hypothetical protein
MCGEVIRCGAGTDAMVVRCEGPRVVREAAAGGGGGVGGQPPASLERIPPGGAARHGQHHPGEGTNNITPPITVCYPNDPFGQYHPGHTDSIIERIVGEDPIRTHNPGGPQLPIVGGETQQRGVCTFFSLHHQTLGGVRRVNR